MSIAEALRRDAARIVVALGLDAASASIEVRALMAAALRVDRAWLISHSKDPFPASRMEYDAMLARRLKGEPVAYILGFREFYGTNFRVSPDVLIPRPETELLVDLALARIPEKGSLRVLDLGTGSGIIAITIAAHRKNAAVTAVDRSRSALVMARENGESQDNLHFIESDWFENLEGERFDLIASNPPYIAAGDRHLEQGDLRYEPSLALSSGADGLDSIRKIISDAPAHLKPGGWLLFEHGFDQGPLCRDLLSEEFFDVASWRDISGIERVSGGIRLT